jgi:hypothetical protein
MTNGARKIRHRVPENRRSGVERKRKSARLSGGRLTLAAVVAEPAASSNPACAAAAENPSG